MRIPRPDVGSEISRRLLKEFSWHSHECARRARPYLRPILVRLHVTSPWRLAQKAGKTCARIIPTQAASPASGLLQKTWIQPATGRYVNERPGRGLEIAHSLASPDSVLIHPYPQCRVRARVDAAAAQGHGSTLYSDTSVGLFTQCPF